MFVLVDLEHESYSRWEESCARQLKFKSLIENLSGEECILVRHNRLNLKELEKLGVGGIIVSGNFTDFEEYKEEDLRSLYKLYEQPMCPILSICGGFQLMVQNYGGVIGPMNGTSSLSVVEDEQLLFDRTNESLIISGIELGYTKLSRLKAGRILANVPNDFIVYQYHYWHVKALPEGFNNLAKSEYCEIQLITHNQKPLYGCEFHPEISNNEFPHGKQILTNFLDIAKSY